MKKIIRLFALVLMVNMISCQHDESCIWYQETSEMSNLFLKYDSYPMSIENSDTIISTQLIFKIGFTLKDVTTHLECKGLSPNANSEVLGTINSFIITTKYDYNDQFLAGDTINACFDLYKYYRSSHYTTRFEKESSFTEFLNNPPVKCRNNLFLLMNSNVDTVKVAQFNISYTEESGKHYELDTREIILKP